MQGPTRSSPFVAQLGADTPGRAVQAEVARVVRPGGRLVAAETILTRSLDADELASVDDWFRCIGGALPEAERLGVIGRAGFIRVRRVDRRRNARTGHDASAIAVVVADRV